MYRSFVLPQLDYADVVWDNCSLKLADYLESLLYSTLPTFYTFTPKHSIQTPSKFAEYYYPPARDPNISNNMNSLIFKAVLGLIVQSGRFAVE